MKAFYIVSALRTDSSELANLKRFKTEKEATNHAMNVIKWRREKGSDEIMFYVLKVCVSVGAANPPIKITKLK